MKQVWTILIISFLFMGCQKEVLTENIKQPVTEIDLPVKSKWLRPILPDTFRAPDVPLWPRLPRPSLDFLPLSTCINSFTDLIGYIGANKVSTRGVMLENDVELLLGNDLLSITYQAVDEQHATSLFNSQLTIDWRRPGENWQSHYSDVWSLGCEYESTVQGPFTNLKKGNTILLINTCIYWGAIPYQGLRVKYILLN